MKIPDDMLELVRPMSISLDELKSMSDDELLKILAGKTRRKGEVTPKIQNLVTAELIRRNIQNSSKPHWTALPSFWLLVASTFLALVAAVVGIFSLPQVQELFSANQQQQKQAHYVGKNQQSQQLQTKQTKPSQ